MSDLTNVNFDTMTVAEFEEYLPDLFATGGGKVSEDPRFAKFLKANPDCAALVSDLETIAEHARSLFEPTHEPSDSVWSNIADKLKNGIVGDEDGINGTEHLAAE
ncbi:hypothetical protein [Granulicella mallensis]|uniref:Uncharacterized protein n=1 Tax=Granulicella mallensis (strain ATCC BAA-1857 / DSM 23137 / MP5ACTX8) TaxID=682795 RepID=G8NR07_GRAMM|nr:hypothetical protein [Granulicella mallensis]AEU34992.1 hypothetical protein AciX8_0642 [Granulicella mallensis MP5ACTX8]